MAGGLHTARPYPLGVNMAAYSTWRLSQHMAARQNWINLCGDCMAKGKSQEIEKEAAWPLLTQLWQSYRVITTALLVAKEPRFKERRFGLHNL